MPRFRRTFAAAAAIAVVACSSSDPEGGPSAGPTATPTSGITSRGGAEEPSSRISTGQGDDVRSEVEVRVGEIISEYEGVETGEGTQLSIDADVLFAFDEASLLPEATARLDDIVEVLDFYGDAPVEILVVGVAPPDGG